MADAALRRLEAHDALAVLDDDRGRQVRGQLVAAADGPGARATAAVRGAETLVQVEVNHVEAEVAVAHAAHDRVEVRAVAVEVGPGVVDEVRDLLDALFPEPEGVRHRDHHRRDGLVQLVLDRRAVERTIGRGGDLRDSEPCHRRRRRVRAVRRVRDEDAAARLQLAAVLEGARDHEHARQLALRAGGGREADRGQARHLGEAAAQFQQDAERALRLLGGGLRVRRREARQRRHEVVDLRVVLHRARTQRIGAGVDAVIPRGERGVVAHEAALAQLRQSHRVA